MIIGGSVPLGIHDMARSDIATTWAIAWPMSVPGKNESSHKADLLDVPRVDVLDAVDVLEVQLELVDDEPLHLVGAHADVVEEDVDLRGVQRGEDVHPHPFIEASTPPLIRATTSIKVVIGWSIARTVGFADPAFLTVPSITTAAP